MIAEIIVDDRGLNLRFCDDGESFKIIKLSPLSEMQRTFRLCVAIKKEEGKTMYPFRRVCRGGTKDHEFIPLHRDGEIPGFVEREYEIDIPLQIDGGKVHTHYPENSANLMVVSKGGLARMYQYSLVGRLNQMFLVRQLLFECEVREGEIFFPKTPWMEFRPWARIWEEKTLMETLRRWNWTIPKTEGTREFSPVFPRGRNNTAFVLWFNVAMGYGYAQLVNGNRARVHWSQLIKTLYLRPGAFVAFKQLDLCPSRRREEVISQLKEVCPL